MTWRGISERQPLPGEGLGAERGSRGRGFEGLNTSLLGQGFLEGRGVGVAWAGPGL